MPESLFDLGLQLYLQKDSGKGDFLRILRNFNFFTERLRATASVVINLFRRYSVFDLFINKYYING